MRRTIYHRMKKPKRNAQAHKGKVMSRFNAELRWQTEDGVQTLLELNAEDARIMREQNSRRRVERITEMTAEEQIQDQEITQHTNEH